MNLLSCLLHCPLGADRDCLDRPYRLDPDTLTDYLNRSDRENKIVNITDLRLCDERDGIFSYLTGDDLIETDPDSDRKTLYGVRGGLLVKELEFRQKGFPGIQGACLHAHQLFMVDLDQEDGWGQMLTTCVLSETGKVLLEVPIGQHRKYSTILDEDHVVINGACWNIRTREKEWDIREPFEHAFDRMRVTLLNGRLYGVADNSAIPRVGAYEPLWPAVLSVYELELKKGRR